MIGNQTTPITYCRRLAAYMSDIGGIRAQCIREFGKAPAREAIEAMRAEIVEARERKAKIEREKYHKAITSGHEYRTRVAA